MKDEGKRHKENDETGGEKDEKWETEETIKTRNWGWVNE